MFSTSTPQHIMVNRLRLLGFRRNIDYEVLGSSWLFDFLTLLSVVEWIDMYVVLIIYFFISKKSI